VTLIELDELGPPVELQLTPELGRLLTSSGVVSAVPSTFRSGFWLIGPAGKVGAARVGDLEIQVRPKLSIARLLFLAGYSRHVAAWRQETMPVAEAADLIPVVAQALWRQTERAVHQGLLPGYIVVEESSPVLRGRLRESEQLHRHHGLPLPLEIRHDEFTIDIPENQILRTACERMLTVPRVDGQSQRMLRRLLRDFSEVTSLSRGDPIPPWQPTRLNARYHVALRLAEIVLRATSVEHRSGSVLLNGFLFDMPALFEDFVTVALREALVTEFGGRVDGQDRHYLDQAARVVLRPDIVWKVRGSPVAVIDAKYKAEKPAGYPNADLYQLLAYCTVLGLREGHLVYAKGNEEPARHVIRQSGTEIFCHALDLSQSPDALLGQIRDLAQLIASSHLFYAGHAPSAEAVAVLLGGLGFSVALAGELENPRRRGDLRLRRLQDRIPVGRTPGGERLTEVFPVWVSAEHLQPLAFADLLAERLALSGQVADPGGHLADLLVRLQG
jgi:5-methylcytosine-specific restriction enzyme subunit McrC